MRNITGGSPKPLEKVMIFIDGGYLRKLFNDLFGDDNIDFLKLRNYMLDLYNRTPINPFRANLIRTYYYDGITDKKEKEYEKQREYFDSLSLKNSFLTVRLGEAVKKSDGSLRQKGVDILICVDALTMAYLDYYDTGLFLLADRDFIPLIKAVKNAGRKTFSFCYQGQFSKELAQIFDFRYGFTNPEMEKWQIKQ
ncbi:MAG: NYN domain-containing protein [Candidatus Bathyarchaeota archaeon]|nr:NYN domain-containing protein [Candidatus Bathyarchaeota archaeon]MDH5495000.1 NYN domain-containing protein [Candidatus Bathyarchaeota archaeon]